MDSESYIRLLKTEINWLKKNGDAVDSYETACKVREEQTSSHDMKRRYHLEYGILKRFDIDGVYPDFRKKEPLIKRGAYYQLNSEYKEVIDLYQDVGLRHGLKQCTIKGNASCGSCFLLAMQKKGIFCLSEIREEAAMSFFTDSSGNVILSSGYKKQIAAVLKSDLDKYTSDARRILAYLPRIRPKRKNIPYLQPEETEHLHEALGSDSVSTLRLRNKAIGTLLFFTGLRACDIAGLTLDDIDWGRDEIRIVQSKTEVPLILPLSAMIGNALFDYITLERPESNDPHVFLGVSRPHDPITAGAIWLISSKVYDAASIRMSKGERRGSHLFRYNAATTFIENGIPRPVASATLGHEDPASLDYYTFADIKHLRECALSIERFAVKEGVFDI
ncbi:MAG: tyrosine-type recombinase/integrase [Lachnospiraceae bacterium]